MKRRLRIAVSVLFALVAVALCGLWVRSYYRWDTLGFAITDNRGIVFFHWEGNASVRFAHTPDVRGPLPTWWYHNSVDEEQQKRPGDVGFFVQPSPFGWTIGAPYWFVLVVVTAFGLAPWLRMRFSLRTLLIAMTLVAVVLGLGVWLAS